MSRQLLGKRPRSHSCLSSPSPSSSPSRSPTPARKTRRIARELPSPDPTPNPKRVKISITEVEQDDGSNKENIPPEPSLSNASLNSISNTSIPISPMTPRAVRASRRATAEPTRSTPVSRTSARSHADISSDRMSGSPSLSRRATRLPSAIETPSKTIARLSLTTPPPTPPSVSLPSPPEDAIDKPTSLQAQARTLLRPQGSESTPLVGREQERARILDFLTPFLSDVSHPNAITSLYVSGAPGTGKTALVNEILASIPATWNQRSTDNVPMRVIYVNCMALGAKGGLTGVWERCIEDLGVTKEPKRGSPTKVDWNQRFSKLFQNQKCILVLDEIDHLAASSSTSMSVSQVFAIAAAPQTRASLRVIGISNTHTLTHATPSSDTCTIHFEPYTAAQMKAVLSARLAALPNDNSAATKLFPVGTLALLTMKIASQTGDIRTVFSVARRALDLAVAGAASSLTPTVTPAHILAALKASNTSTGISQGKNGSETVTRVRNLGLHARFALAALLLATRRVVAGLSLTTNSSSAKLKENANQSSVSSTPGHESAPPSIDMTALHGFYATILNQGANAAFYGVGRTEFADLVGLLEGSGLVELTHGRGFASKTKGAVKNKGVQVVCIASGIREEELVRGLVGSFGHAGVNDTAVNVREEEVKHVWEREAARIGRECRARLRNQCVKKADLEGAEED